MAVHSAPNTAPSTSPTPTVGASGAIVMANRRFMDDFAKLQAPVQAKVSERVGQIREHGVRYPGLETRKVQGNHSGDFHFMDIDYSHRMVVVLSGKVVFLEKVGEHDPTERWAQRATLREYEKRMAVDQHTFRKEQRRQAKQQSDAMFDLGPELQEIVDSGAATDVLTECLDGVLEGWTDGTLEDWMVFLSPMQRRAVDRAANGPSRITGGPGTGKTVVGLHRAAALASTAGPDERILMTSFVNTVTKTLSGLYERIAPESVGQVEFRTVHDLALSQLGRSLVARPDGVATRSRFHRVLQSDKARHRALLFDGGFSEEYLWEEVTRVIIGRGVASLDEYRDLKRVGRRIRMSRSVREIVWDIYTEYVAACREGDAVIDWDSVLRLARDHARARGVRRRFAAIIVDEAQDITQVGIEFLLEILQGGPDGRLMLIGDGGQRIYPGGFSLSDLGLAVSGRSIVLDLSYRSTDEIMAAVGALGRSLPTDELGEDGLSSLAQSTARFGPRPQLHVFETPRAEVEWVASQLDPDDERMDSIAILVPTNTMAEEWQDALRGHDIGSALLKDYGGRPTPGVKIGTFHRAKGLEFERVYIPRLNGNYPRDGRNDEAVTIHGIALYVAMSRARDLLVMTHAGRASTYLEAIEPHCDVRVHLDDEEAVAT